VRHEFSTNVNDDRSLTRGWQEVGAALRYYSPRSALRAASEMRRYAPGLFVALADTFSDVV